VKERSEVPISSNYAGHPFVDDRATGLAQVIPGDIMCAYFDLGGEGVGYHTKSVRNEGSGVLNPPDGSYLNEFRIDEPVGTTFTKPDIDDTEFNAVHPELGMHYLGWTEAGQWTNYSIASEKSTTYRVSLLHTAARSGGAVSLAIDGVDVTGPRDLPSMYDDRDEFEWRQVHHWNWASLGLVPITAGPHILTLTVAISGQLNLAKLRFDAAA
jgi:hypothetical protein